jgi:TPR repeat protein
MAQFNIGLMYADGLGVKVDKTLARQWFEKAAASGNEPAIARLGRIDAAVHKP